MGRFICVKFHYIARILVEIQDIMPFWALILTHNLFISQGLDLIDVRIQKVYCNNFNEITSHSISFDFDYSIL